MNLGFGLNLNETAQESGYDQYKMNLYESSSLTRHSIALKETPISFSDA